MKYCDINVFIRILNHNLYLHSNFDQGKSPTQSPYALLRQSQRPVVYPGSSGISLRNNSFRGTRPDICRTWGMISFKYTGYTGHMRLLCPIAVPWTGPTTVGQGRIPAPSPVHRSVHFVVCVESHCLFFLPAFLNTSHWRDPERSLSADTIQGQVSPIAACAR
jgi:hypothetical protein